MNQRKFAIVVTQGFLLVSFALDILTLLAILFPFVSPLMARWGAISGGLLGGVMVLLAMRFLKSGRRPDARTLFFYTLLYLPLMMFASYLAWVAIAVPAT